MRSSRTSPRESRGSAEVSPVRLKADPTSARRRHEQWLKELTCLPTAAGLEHNVIAWIERWTARRTTLRMTRDRAGNILVRQARARQSPRRAPLFITAHMDHPAFVVTDVRGSDVDLEFRGNVHDPYFQDARIEIIDGRGRAQAAAITRLATVDPLRRVTARLDRAADTIERGNIARWAFSADGPLPRIADGLLHTHACDDLAGVAAAVSAMDVLSGRQDAGHVGLLFTRAEEIGFIGAIAACKARSVPRDARLVCLETSRSFAESPIGAGPIVRVGDRMSVFEPSLTNAISLLMIEHQKRRPQFTWQRRLMPGGTCEATTFSTYGYTSTCLCLPLGNYHNMADIDGVAAGKRPALVGPEFISLSDFHGLVDMLVVCATKLDAPGGPSLREQMEQRFRQHGSVLGPLRKKVTRGGASVRPARTYRQHRT